jgi:hypothetical protein
LYDYAPGSSALGIGDADLRFTRRDVQEEILKQVHMICENHGSACLEDVIDEILIEAGRIGSGHSDGTFYRH